MPQTPKSQAYPRLLAYARNSFRGFGILLVAISLGADLLGIGEPGSGLGTKQLIMLVAGICIFLLGTFVADRYFLGYVLKPCCFALSVYVALLCSDLGLSVFGPQPRESGFVRGLYQPDDSAGYRLAANFHGVDDDGVVRAEYQTNSLGHRDQELDALGESQARCLLIGDSYTFGLRLNEQSTIATQMERISRGAVDAYNLGVPGYGPPSILAELQRCEDIDSDHVIYFFYENDLILEEMDAHSRTSVDGFMVPRAKADGTPYSQQELANKVTERFSPSWRSTVKKHLRLSTIWRLWATRRTPAWADNSSGASTDQAHTAADIVEQMRNVATSSKRSEFQVVIIPSIFEVKQNKHVGATEQFIDLLRARGITVVDLLGAVSLDGYFLDEGHFNPTGARVAAEQSLQSIGFMP